MLKYNTIILKYQVIYVGSDKDFKYKLTVQM